MKSARLRNYDGVGTILETRKILLLASGMNKAKAITKAIEGPVTAMVPASALQLRHDVMVILDLSGCSKASRSEVL
jgi:glucosamine-6-phosphate deaminase